MITTNLGHPTNDDLRDVDTLDLGATRHVDDFVESTMDFFDRGLRTPGQVRDYSGFMPLEHAF